LDALGQVEEFLPQLPGPPVFPAEVIHIPHPPQHPEHLGGLSYALAQLACAGVHPFHFGGPSALERHQHRAERHLHSQLLPRTLRRVRQGLEQREPLRQVGDRVHIGRALTGALPCPLPVWNRVCIEACLGVVMG
jgi:hypothetical protein